ncbi:MULTISPECIES: Nramp family divalent metal transporter [Micrococcaceae]|jgi:manganese transport protein|uniref:H+-stimulated manganese uptake system protein n=3 Tax=Micrococcaceae TaxID=1268 RepID=Q6SK77_PAEAU|nr:MULTISPECIES: Nramp family divalent metal transporter [Micrococcaceae]AAS20095.1 H+-stimulated manganese uptake system protein [Paenarthrobacter aurescens]ABM10383.1 H(+)-stimulated manganese uptake protein, NRAMP-family Mn2+/Fe2+ transporters [Paenarthrobacter aurescens TC1]SDQ03293.1 manganese transport protein [Arthrobacter crystallopoietes]
MPVSPVLTGPRSRPRVLARLLLLGPAFVAAIAYVDPGNVAANLTAGAQYGFLLVWVLVMANAMAVLVQYQSAKLGLATGMSLPEILGKRLPTGRRRAYWLQAEAVAGATDMAEVIGGAVALNLLFGLPLLAGGVIVGAASMVLLAVQSMRGQRSFENIIIVLLAVIAGGFMTGLFVNPPDPGEALRGLIPGFDGTATVLLAASMLGATVMPHAIYLHSALARDRHGYAEDPTQRQRLIRATRWDVVGALLVAGAVNIAMLLLAASSLRGTEGTDTIAGAHAAITEALGPVVGVIFGVGLLASGLASTSVGCYAGATIMGGLLHVRIPLLLRRFITLIPALIILGAGIEPTWALVLSQVLLSFGIPFALIPLIRLTGNREIMGIHVDSMPLRVAGIVSAVLIVGLNCVLIVLTISGQ